MIKKLLAFVGTFGADPNKVAQMAHGLAGFAAGSTLGLPGALVIVLAWGVPKEAYLDPKYEHAPFFWDGAIDLSFYVLGAALGTLYYFCRFGALYGK